MQPKTRVTVADYLAMDAASSEKLELVDGQIVAMSGASIAHGRIQANVMFALMSRVRPPCEVFGSDTRILLEETGSYAYPDVTVVCGEPDATETSPPSVRNPRVVVEVLSESTASYDLIVKGEHYRSRASIDAILFVDSRRRHVQVQTRSTDDNWLLQTVVAGSVRIPALGIDVALDEVYRQSGL